MIKLSRATDQKTYVFDDGPDVLTIGRAGSNQVMVDDPHVSALHGQITRREDGYAYQDLNSTNGSAIEREGKRTVVDPGQSTGHLLQAGDRILLGSETEPVAVEVLACELHQQALPRGQTVVARQRMASLTELGGRIESQGGTLMPYVTLSESLAQADQINDAFEAFCICMRSAVEGTGPIHLRGSSLSSQFQAQDSPAGAVLNEELLLGNCSEAELTLHADEKENRRWASIPIELESKRCIWLVVGLPETGFKDTQLDAINLAADLLGSRLAQLDLVLQLKGARARLAAKNRYLRERSERRSSQTIVGSGAAMSELAIQIRKVAPSDATVLITGPSGSGKELVAREIHRLSPRHAEIFAAVNCGALVESLLESELFGCVKGAFTGADRDREGLFEVAHGGTLFLDEIGDMSTALQVKLLRVLESQEVTPVGGTRSRRVDVRVLAATNRDLGQAIEDGRFREDLFYRLNVFPITVCGLDKRREDIPELARHLLSKFAESSGASVHEFSEEAISILTTRDYPGNVRQLANLIQRAVLLAGDSERILPEHLIVTDEDAAVSAVRKAGRGPLKKKMDRVEKALVLQALNQHDNNRTHAARQLGITRQALLGKLNKYGIK